MSERFVCVLNTALYKHCIYFLFVLYCVTDCFNVLSLRFVDVLIKAALPYIYLYT